MKVISFYFIIPILFISTNLIPKESSKIISDELKIVYKGNNRLQMTRKQKIFIAQKKDENLGKIVVFENQYQRLKKLKCIIFDKNGKKIKRLKKKHARIIDASSYYVLYSGAKYYVLETSHLTYPYTVEYSYTVDILSNFFWPNWLPQSSVPVETSTYSITLKKDFSFNTKLISNENNVQYTVNGNTHTWVENNIPKKASEYKAAPEDLLTHGMYITPDYFKIDGIAGSFADWNQFGNWYYRLYSDQLLKYDSRIPSFKFSDTLSTPEKIQRLYQYVQEQTRYVAIELGIHGWKPHSSLSVLNNKYGDCKDLTTFFISTLRQNGIAAYPALILTRSNGLVDETFPMNRFNHMITFIPTEEDTFWVDCTSDNTTIYDLPHNNEGCNVLVIQNAFGKIISTPVSTSADNQMVFQAVCEINQSGALSLKGKIYGYGNSKQFLKGHLTNTIEEDQRNFFIGRISKFLPQIELNKYKIIDSEKYERPMIVSFSINVNKAVNKSRNRSFFNPSFFSQHKSNFENPKKRKTSVYFPYPITQLDSIIIKYPDEFELEAVPDDIHLQYPFGSYDYSLSIADNIITFVRKYEIKKQIIDINDYYSFYNFMRDVEKSDKRNIVFINVEE